VLTAYDFEILYQKETLNLADKSSKRFDYGKYTEARNRFLLSTFRNKLKRHRTIEINENAEKANIENIRIAVLIRQKKLSNSKTITNAENE
jgi:hypothetical protein